MTYDTLASSQRVLTISSGVTITVKDAAVSCQFSGGVINNGTFVDGSTGNGVFMGSNGSFTNSSTGILNIDKRFDILEGTLINNGSVNISAGNEHTILVMGGIITNNDEFINDGAMNMDISTGKEGAVYDRGTTFTNTGTFINGSISNPANSAYFGIMSSTFDNTGDYVSNGQMDINYTSFTHSAGTFNTYNSGSITFVGSSFSTNGAPIHSFSNEGYMRVIDQYNKDGYNYICNITLGTDTFDNDSNWLDYTAEVYSQAGLTACRNRPAE